MHYTVEILEDYLHGALGPERDAEIHAHLEACAPCRGTYDEAAAVRDWLRSAARAEEREFPETIRTRVWAVIRHPEPTFMDRLRAAFRPAIAVPVAAVIAVAAFAGLPAVRSSGTPQAAVAASYLLEEHAAVAADNPLADRGLVVSASVPDDQQPALINEADTAAVSDR
jgi:predicted anti-sigma-YlaC factor YlaD